MMRKIILQIIICIFLSMTNFILDAYPACRVYLKHYVCNLDLSEFVGKMKSSSYLLFLDKIEEVELDQLSEFQKQFCNKKQYK